MQEDIGTLSVDEGTKLRDHSLLAGMGQSREEVEINDLIPPHQQGRADVTVGIMVWICRFRKTVQYLHHGVLWYESFVSK
jgi:hypothetical protein